MEIRTHWPRRRDRDAGRPESATRKQYGLSVLGAPGATTSTGPGSGRWAFSPLRARVPAVVQPAEQQQQRRAGEKGAEKAPGVNRTRENQEGDQRDDPANHAEPSELEKEAGTESLVLVPRREGAVLFSGHLRQYRVQLVCRLGAFLNTGPGEHDLLAKTRRKRRSACAA